MIRATSFTPTGASARAFQPRLWLALQPEDPGFQDGKEVERPCLWALLVFNGGPDLTDLQVEIQPEGADEAAHRFEIPLLEEGAVAHLFGGGPSLEPAHGVYRVQATTRAGIEIALAARFRDLARPAHLPGFVAEQPCLPLAPGAPWHPDEFVALLADSYLRTGQPSASPASLAFSRRVTRLLRGVERRPSRGAAREIVWSAVRGVFGAQDSDLELPAVRQQVEELSQDVLELADFLVEIRRPLPRVPEGEVSFALLPGQVPELYLVNTFDQDLEGVRVRLGQLHWGGRPSALAPREAEFGRVPAHSAVRVARLEGPAGHGDLEATCVTGPLQGFVETRHRALFPEESLEEADSLIPVDELAGRLAQVRRTESSAVLEPASGGEEDGPGRLAA